jgi:hypothetical protein
VTGMASFVCICNGNRVKKAEGGQTIRDINQNYEKNMTTARSLLIIILGDNW